MNLLPQFGIFDLRLKSDFCIEFSNIIFHTPHTFVALIQGTINSFAQAMNSELFTALVRKSDKFESLEMYYNSIALAAIASLIL